MREWLSQFQSQFGDAVTTDTAGFAVQDVTPACIASPSTEDQAAAMIRFAAANRIPVVPCGGNTQQARLAPPPKDFLALSTQRLNKLIHHEPGDMIATVQGGMTFSDFNEAISAGNQFLPIDSHQDSTIGGMVAANTSGSRAHGCGTLRDMILGMTVINGDGVVRKCGGKVVKNVTGYSLDKLYIGSFGTLGLVTEVTLKLRPFPAKARGWIVLLPDFNTGVALVQKIAVLNLPVDLIEIVSPRAISHLTDEFARFNYFNVFACGTRAEMERIGSELRKVVPAEFEVGRTTVGDIPYEQKIRCQLRWGTDLGFRGYANAEWFKQRAGHPGATLRFGCVASKLTDAIKIVNDWNAVPRSVMTTGGALDLSPLSDAEAARISTELEKLRVNFAWENIVGVTIPNRWGKPRPEWAIMKQIKAALDPQGIMNPGRFVV